MVVVVVVVVIVVVVDDRLWCAGLTREVRREDKRAAPTRFAFHVNRATHQGHQAGRNGQAQSSAAVLARGRGVLLLESPEDGLLLVLRDADAAVTYRELQCDLAVRRAGAGYRAGRGRRRLPPARSPHLPR